MQRIDSASPRIGRFVLAIMLLAGCDVTFKNTANIRNSCQLLRGMDMETEICTDGRPCIQHGLSCEDSVYSPRVSPHTKTDWRADYKGYFRASKRPERITAAFDEHKKWGIGEDRFFVISDNIDAPTESSATLYFYLNAYNMPRVVGATFFDADTQQITEYSFRYNEGPPHDNGFRPDSGSRELFAERTFSTAKAD